jgi:bifunctional oligoribonuclease and PAP phosphatase NrnA
MSQPYTKLAVALAADAPTRTAPSHGVSSPLASVESDRIAAILDVLRRGQRFLVCSHAQPDGDSVGSMLALGMVLEQMGKHADLVAADRIPAHYRRLPGVGAIQTMWRVRGHYDAVILLECDSLQRSRLRGLEDFFQINIDHHISGQEFASLNWIDHEAVSAGEMVYRLARAAGARLTPQMATCLYITVLTDTGGFCYGAVRESTFALARELVLAGADPIAIAQDVYFSSPASKLLLLGAALSRLNREDHLAWLWVTHADTLESHASEDDSDGIVDYALGVEGVEAAFFLRELPEGRIRVSLRSKGKIDVAAIAECLGGGGHENAAGCTLDGPLARARDAVLAHLRPAVAHWSGNPA